MRRPLGQLCSLHSCIRPSVQLPGLLRGATLEPCIKTTLLLLPVTLLQGGAHKPDVGGAVAFSWGGGGLLGPHIHRS